MQHELVTHFGVKLNVNPSLERGGVTPAEMERARQTSHSRSLAHGQDE